MDEFVIETNLVYIENKNNGRYMTLDEANYVKKLSNIILYFRPKIKIRKNTILIKIKRSKKAS